MNASPKLTPNKYDLIVAAAVLALAVLLGARFWGAPGAAAEQGGALTVVVEIDGEEADRFALTQIMTEARTYTNNGISLTVAASAIVEQDAQTAKQSETLGVRVLESNCPTQDCVHTGQISKAGQSIVCLPARIVITLVGTNTDYDVIAG